MIIEITLNFLFNQSWLTVGIFQFRSPEPRGMPFAKTSQRSQNIFPDAPNDTPNDKKRIEPRKETARAKASMF